MSRSKKTRGLIGQKCGSSKGLFCRICPIGETSPDFGGSNGIIGGISTLFFDLCFLCRPDLPTSPKKHVWQVLPVFDFCYTKPMQPVFVGVI